MATVPDKSGNCPIPPAAPVEPHLIPPLRTK